MKDICEAAGLSRGGLYTHYGSTGQVFADIIEELMSGLESQVAGKMERGLPASLILDELLERYQSEMLDRSFLICSRDISTPITPWTWPTRSKSGTV